MGWMRPDVLLVDPAWFETSGIPEALSTEGYSVCTASGPREALEALLRTELLPQVIVVGVREPGLEGLALVDEVRRTPAISHVPVVGLSDLRLPPDRTASFDGWMPIRAERLLEFLDCLRVRKSYGRPPARGHPVPRS